MVTDKIGSVAVMLLNLLLSLYPVRFFFCVHMTKVWMISIFASSWILFLLDKIKILFHLYSLRETKFCFLIHFFPRFLLDKVFNEQNFLDFVVLFAHKKFSKNIFVDQFHMTKNVINYLRNLDFACYTSDYNLYLKVFDFLRMWKIEM